MYKFINFKINVIQNFQFNSSGVCYSWYEHPCNSNAIVFLKVSIFGVFLVRIFPHSDWIRRNKTPNTDTFHAMLFIKFSLIYINICKCKSFLLHKNLKELFHSVNLELNLGSLNALTRRTNELLFHTFHFFTSLKKKITLKKLNEFFQFGSISWWASHLRKKILQ